MGGVPGSSVVKTHGTCAPSPVGELRSHILCSVAKKEGGEEKKSQKEREEEKKGGRESEGRSDEGKE